jgi:hypothetical protein
MKCFGRTKTLKRCKKHCKFIYCEKHKLQWWTIIVIMVTIATFHQHYIRPLYAKKPNDFIELIGRKNKRKKKIDSAFYKSYFQSDKLAKDSNFSINDRKKITIYKINLKNAHKDFNELNTDEINALKEGELILSLEYLKQILQLPEKYKIDPLSTDSLLRTFDICNDCTFVALFHSDTSKNNLSIQKNGKIIFYVTDTLKNIPSPSEYEHQYDKKYIEHLERMEMINGVKKSSIRLESAMKEQYPCTNPFDNNNKPSFDKVINDNIDRTVKDNYDRNDNFKNANDRFR